MPSTMRRLVTTVMCLYSAGPTLALASEQLALEQGCFVCHGQPARKNAPSFAQLANSYAPYQGKPEMAQALADKLRRPPLFGGISAHEHLSEASALALIQWLIDGAP